VSKMICIILCKCCVNNCMKRKIARSLLCMIIILTPCLGFSWGEGKNFIDDVEIYSICLDSNYVFCGTNADWGANRYGLFILNRKTGQWQNYSEANSILSNDIVTITKIDSFVDVAARIGKLRFKLPSLDYEIVDSTHHRAYRHFYDSVVLDNRVYEIALDSVIVQEDNQCVSIPVFRSEDYTKYFGGPIVTDCFLYDSSVILTTAFSIYEANVAPASGFLELSPHDLSVKPWSKIKLSDEPLALLCVEQDEKELWIGTNRGVYCIEKKTGRKTHYNITKGIVVAETLKVRSDQREHSPVIYEYYKGDSVKIFGEQEFSLEIALPDVYNGYLSKDYVKEEIDDPIRGRVAIIKDFLDLKDWGYLITIKASNSWDSTTVAEFHYYYLPSKEFVFSSKLDNWYYITIPNTGWVPINTLIFHMDKVED